MILKLGSKGEAIIKLQKMLGLMPDGLFGRDTKEAVVRFQEEKGLTPDGIVGPKTIDALTELDIKPSFDENKADDNEDKSDPDEKMDVDTEDGENEPTCGNILELIELINLSDITREIKKIIYHCTATSQDATVSGITNYWKNNLGWNNPGYHIIVKPNGEWTYLHNFNRISNGVAGHNSNSINVSYIGGVDEDGKALDNRTPKQEDIFKTIYFSFKGKIPSATHHGHNEFSSKACPSYDVSDWINEITEEE